MTPTVSVSASDAPLIWTLRGSTALWCRSAWCLCQCQQEDSAGHPPPRLTTLDRRSDISSAPWAHHPVRHQRTVNQRAI